MTALTPAPELALHSHALLALEEADLAAARAADIGVSAPHRYVDLTPDALSDMLGSHVPGARLVTAEQASRHEGMTDRNSWNLQWNEAGLAARLPEAVFAKVTPDEPYLRETLALLHMAENEVRFYNQLRPELPELAPESYHARYYAGGRFILLMEVLERRDLTPYWLADHCTVDHAKAVVAALARLHATYWQSERFTTDLAWVRPRTRRFGFTWHQKSFTTARQAYLQGEIGETVPREVAELIRRWDANDRAVLDYWDRLPATVLHGDSHLGNTFSYPDGSAGFFDWQVMYRGNGLRDVAYFFLGAADEEVRTHEREVFDHYLATLQAHGIERNPEAAWKDYCLFALDSLDANIKTIVRSGYGHSADALNRHKATLEHAIVNNGVIDLLDQVIRDGSL